MRQRRHPNEQHIGNGRGRIALWLDETEAIDLAYLYGLNDLGAKELLDAVERAYPSVEDEEDRPGIRIAVTMREP